MIKLVSEKGKLILGTSFKAFQNQQNKCEVTKGSCIRNQILDILKKEITRKNKGESTDYLVSQMGKFLGTTNESTSGERSKKKKKLIPSS